mgnify:CR=1 FL=1
MDAEMTKCFPLTLIVLFNVWSPSQLKTNKLCKKTIAPRCYNVMHSSIMFKWTALLLLFYESWVPLLLRVSIEVTKSKFLSQLVCNWWSETSVAIKILAGSDAANINIYRHRREVLGKLAVCLREWSRCICQQC